MVGIVLGSGLGVLADGFEATRQVGFQEAGLPSSSVPGHEGRFLIGKIGSRDVILMKGRVHLYEGHDVQVITAGIRWLAKEGADSVILTNAAGTVNKDFPPGQWMMLSDHLNLTGTSPLQGPQFVDMSHVYDDGWREAFRKMAESKQIPLHEGVYAGLRGPQYETPAEIRMLRTLGADAVGMSTVLEAIQARALGLRVVGFSCLTNWAAGMQHNLDHTEVLTTGKMAGQVMADLIADVLSTTH